MKLTPPSFTLQLVESVEHKTQAAFLCLLLSDIHAGSLQAVEVKVMKTTDIKWILLSAFVVGAFLITVVWEFFGSAIKNWRKKKREKFTM